MLPDFKAFVSCAIHWMGLVDWDCGLLRLEPMGVLLVPVRGGGATGLWALSCQMRGGGQTWTRSMALMLGRTPEHFQGIGCLSDDTFPVISGSLCHS